MKNRHAKLLVFLLLIYGLFLRLYSLSYQSYWIDEAFSINAVQMIIEKGVPVLESGMQYFRGLLFHYITAVPVLIFGLSEWSVRVIPALFAAASIIVVYLFARRLFSSDVGLISALFWTFLSISIAWSRQARMYPMLMFLFLSSLYLFWMLLHEKRLRYGILLGICAVAGFMTHPLSYSLPLIFAAYLPVHLYGRDISKKQVLEFISEHAIAINMAIAIIIIAILFRSRYFLSILATDVSYAGSYWLYLAGYGFLFYAAVPGLIIGGKVKERLFVAIAFAVPFYIITNHQVLMHFRYIFFLLPLIIILSSRAFAWLLGELTRVRKILSYAGVLLLLLSVAFSSHFTVLPQKSYELEPQTPQPDFKEAYAFVEDNIEEGEMLISSYAPVAKLYLRRPDYVVDFSMSGLEGASIDLCRNCTTERYCNISLIRNATMLEDVIAGRVGYIVIDSLAARTMDPGLLSSVQSQELVYEEERDFFSAIYVYHFRIETFK